MLFISAVIDDRLPTHNGHLRYVKSTHQNEFWGALLEKAYGKLFGSYEALKGGHPSEAFEDFTGGLAETCKLHEAPKHLFRLLLKAQERYSMIGCGINADRNVHEAKTPEGLVRGHAYSITKVVLMDTGKEKIKMVMITIVIYLMIYSVDNLVS